MAESRENTVDGLRRSCDRVVRRRIRLPASFLEGVSRAMNHRIPVIGQGRHRQNRQVFQQPQGPPVVPEEWHFLVSFEEEYGNTHPFFYACQFIQALKLAKEESKLVFVYLHAPEHPHTAHFCANTLCSDLVVEFLDANFVSWGSPSNTGEGQQMARSLQADGFPFCAVVAPTSGDNIIVLQQTEGPVSPPELVEILQRTIEEQGSAFMNLKKEEEEKIRESRQLREEQDAAYMASLQMDEEKDRFRELLIEEVVRSPMDEERKADAKRPRQELVAKKPISKPNRKSAGIQQKRTPAPTVQKAQPVMQKPFTKPNTFSAGNQRKETAAVEKAQSVTQVRIRFPNGERREQSFLCTDRIRSVYKYIDSMNIPGIGSYRLISNFPRKVYGYEQLDMTLKDADFHPRVALYLELL